MRRLFDPDEPFLYLLIAVGLIVAFTVGFYLLANAGAAGPDAAETVNALCQDHGGVAAGWDGDYSAVCKDGTAVRG